MTYIDLLKKGEKALAKAKANRDVAKLLLLHFSRMEPADLYAALTFDSEVDENEYMAAVQDYIAGKPLQHIRGYEFFMGRKFKVSPSVFIPRPETELLCETVLERTNGHLTDKIVAADLGTGSGAIAVTLALALPNARVFATDLSGEALATAKDNADANGAHVSFLKGDFAQPLTAQGKRCNLVVSNPPYIPSGQTLEARVVDHEPPLALYGGTAGIDSYRRILDQLPDLLPVSGPWLVAFEIGWDQKEELAALFGERFPSARVDFAKDYAGLWRIAVIAGGK